jgi:hypothetical protein
VPVVHFVCMRGMGRCVLGTQREDPRQPLPCEVCLRESRALYRGAPVSWFGYQPDLEMECSLTGLDLNALCTFSWQEVPLGELVLPALRWVQRRHHLVDDDLTRYLLQQFLLSAWNVHRRFGQVLDALHPRSVVIFNGQFFPEAAARHAALSRKVRVITHEVAMQSFSAFFTTGHATAYPIHIPNDYKLSPAQDARLDSYLGQRFQGNFSMAGIRFWPEMKPLGETFWTRALQFKQIVPIFTNVAFDTSQSHANTIFPDMFAWLDAVLEIILANPDTFFVIRAHPDEGRKGKEARESVADWVWQNKVETLPNVLFVNSSEPFSSYELIQHSKFIMVYNSTIGMEAAILGTTVLAGGKARFTQVPMALLPASAAAFRKKAESLLNAREIKTPPEWRLNARKFLYFQLYRTSLPLDAFLEEDGIWHGFVQFKNFKPQALLPESSASIKAVLDGILDNGDFLLEEEQMAMQEYAIGGESHNE